MIRIAICDDEIKARQVLKFALWKTLPDSEKDLTIYEFSSGEKTIAWLKANPGALDVLFLDIEMNGMNGMETARAIRTFNSDLIIVFVTGYADYVFDGYSVNALDYIIKPIKSEKLKDIITRINKTLYKTESKMYTVKNADGLFRIPISDIIYFHSNAHRITLVSTDGNFDFLGKLDDIECNMADDFIRTHQRYLIHIPKVEKVENNSIIMHGQNIPISRSRKKDVMSALTRNTLREDDVW